MATKAEHVTKMDPTQEVKWWRNRISKEEKAEKSAVVGPAKTSRVVGLNTMGTPTILNVKSSESHSPSIASSSSPRKAAASNASVPQITVAVPRATESATGSRAGTSNIGRNRKEGSQISQYSYPRTPQFSEAGSELGTEIMSRLSKLEGELVEERLKRQAAQDEMHELLKRTNI